MSADPMLVRAIARVRVAGAHTVLALNECRGAHAAIRDLPQALAALELAQTKLREASALLEQLSPSGAAGLIHDL